MRRHVFLSVSLGAVMLLSGCAAPANNSQAKAGGTSNTTKALGAGALVTGVGLLPIPFLGPLLAGAAGMSASADAKVAKDEANKKCIAFFEEANTKKWGQAKIEAERRKINC